MPTLSETETPTTEQAPTWDLESLFPGGAASAEFAQFRKQLAADIDAALNAQQTLPRQWGEETRAQWTRFILNLQDLGERVSSALSFGDCLVSQNVSDELGHKINSEIDVLRSRWQGLRTELEAFSLTLDDEQWQALLSDLRLQEIRFYLDEARLRGREKMAPAQEKLALDLAVDGYHAWNRLYDKMAGDLNVDFTVADRSETISLGQLAMYMSHPNRDVRRSAFQKLEAAWETRANLAAMALNAQGGFRLTLYRNREWESFLHEPLTQGRLQKATLDAMWGAVADAAPRLSAYIEAKKQLLGLDHFCWYDQTAPVGRLDRSYTFAEAGTFIADKLSRFSPEMAEFVRMALERRWVEAENRRGKAGGAFCTDFSTFKETRVFMTWGGEYDHLLTLAHELGHSYHGWVLRDKPHLARHYPMNLAETASTFNELRVTDAALTTTDDPGERLMLLDSKLQNAFVMFCNLRARYLFDCAFYAERGEGFVPRARLDELMVQAQREAFGPHLADPEGYHPLFWASKLHFYITGHPFYNFPYVFGFLFANSVYDRARTQGASFAAQYRDLLADTGRMTTEEIGAKHLGVDLTQRAFWDAATSRILADVEPFTALTREVA